MQIWDGPGFCRECLKFSESLHSNVLTAMSELTAEKREEKDDATDDEAPF